MSYATGSTRDGQVYPNRTTEKIGRPVDASPDAVNSGSTSEPSRDELLDLYKVAVEEYRFQVQLNWDRAKYFLGFNTAVIGVGTGLIKVGDSHQAAPLLIGIFVVGLVAAALSGCAVYLQHNYYRSTRDRMVSLDRQLSLQGGVVATTPGIRGERVGRLSRLGRVQNILYTLLVIIALVDILGIVYVSTH
jgi:hypothetical protein